MRVTRTDLTLLNLRSFLDFRQIWPTTLIVLVLVAAIVMYLNGVPSAPKDWFALLLGGLVGGLAAHCVGMILSLLSVALMSDRTSGALGTHDYEFTDEGLVERTLANVTVLRGDRSSFSALRNQRRSIPAG